MAASHPFSLLWTASAPVNNTLPIFRIRQTLGRRFTHSDIWRYDLGIPACIRKRRRGSVGECDNDVEDDVHTKRLVVGGDAKFPGWNCRHRRGRAPRRPMEILRAPAGVSEPKRMNRGTNGRVRSPFLLIPPVVPPLIPWVVPLSFDVAFAYPRIMQFEVFPDLEGAL